MAKGPQAFRTISEASEIIGVPAHVLRSWEARLPFVRPMKLSGGRRFYRPKDIEVLVEVRRLLQDEGLSLGQVRELRRRRGSTMPIAPMPGRAQTHLAGDRRSRLKAALGDLLAAQARLSTALRRLI